MDGVSELVSLCIGVLGVAGLIYTALKFNRDDTTAIVGQQDTIMREMKSLNDELRITVARIREERDALQAEVEALTARVRELRGRG